MRRSYRIPTPLVAASFAVFVLGASVASRAATCCPFCSAPSLTMTEQVTQADVVVLAQWTGGVKGVGEDPGSTKYQIAQILKNDGDALKVGGDVTLTRYRTASKGDLFLLLGTKGKTIEWSSPLETTETGYNYVAQAPTPETPTEKRLAYFVKFLEFPDPLVANDAYGEFANAPYEKITPLAPSLPRERLRKWVASPDTPATRLGLYGLLLGLCGDETDAAAMEKQIVATTRDFRLGIDGVMSGYLLITGSKGLDVVDRTKLTPLWLTDAKGEPLLNDKGEKQPFPFSETYAAMQAVRFMWDYGAGKIEKERLRQSMRLLLQRPELADLVIADLARWKDWSVQDRLMEVYGSTEYDIPAIKRAIVRFMLVSVKDKPKDPEVPAPHVERGQRYLDELRKKDPKTVEDAERFFFLN